jgi:hypothetical protein
MEKASVPSVTLIVGCGVSSLTLLMLVIIYVSVWRWVPALGDPATFPVTCTTVYHHHRGTSILPPVPDPAYITSFIPCPTTPVPVAATLVECY